MSNKIRSENIWYNKYWLSKETPEFNSWFSEFYGAQAYYPDEERDEYLNRKAFALMGWLGRNGEIE